MKKCKGCGVSLQSIDKNAIGYCVNDAQDYCQRCFRLTHYDDVSNFSSSYVSNERILDIYKKYQNGLFVVIVDVIDALLLDKDDLLDIFKDYKTILIINKTDLLPTNISDSKIDNIFTKLLFNLNSKYPNIISAILTNKFEDRFNETFFSILDKQNISNIIFAGRANAGKSSLINKILNNNDITTSIYPGTTLDEIEIDYQNYIFIDTPGLVDVNNYSTHLSYEKYKLSKLEKTIKPQVFQLFENQSYFYEGLLWIDVLCDNKCSISFYINNNNEIHRTKYDNSINYYESHYKDFNLKVKPLVTSEYDVKNNEMFVVKGLGFFKVNGNCKILIHSLKNVKLYSSSVEI